jgi:hypothetical protein
VSARLRSRRFRVAFPILGALISRYEDESARRAPPTQQSDPGLRGYRREVARDGDQHERERTSAALTLAVTGRTTR